MNLQRQIPWRNNLHSRCYLVSKEVDYHCFHLEEEGVTACCSLELEGKEEAHCRHLDAEETHYYHLEAEEVHCCH